GVDSCHTLWSEWVIVRDEWWDLVHKLIRIVTRWKIVKSLGRVEITLEDVKRSDVVYVHSGPDVQHVSECTLECGEDRHLVTHSKPRIIQAHVRVHVQHTIA